jgi:D-xylulose reductase
MAVAKALGARRVIAVDINQERLDFAKSYAATDIYLPVRLLVSFSLSSLYHPISSLD